MKMRTPAANVESVTSKVQTDFIHALERLIEGRPSDPELKKLASKGRLKISISAVANEAGRSRTLIGHARCRFPAIRFRILEYTKPVVKVRDNSAVIAELRQTVADLRLQLNNALSQQLASEHRCERMEREANRFRRAFERLSKTQPSSIPVGPHQQDGFGNSQ